ALRGSAWNPLHEPWLRVARRRVLVQPARQHTAPAGRSAAVATDPTTIDWLCADPSGKGSRFGPFLAYAPSLVGTVWTSTIRHVPASRRRTSVVGAWIARSSPSSVYAWSRTIVANAVSPHSTRRESVRVDRMFAIPDRSSMAR